MMPRQLKIAMMAVPLALFASSHVGAQHINSRNGIRHVLLISIDGVHAVDYANCVQGGYCPTLEAVGATGVTYTRTSASKPSDSFPGLMALVPGGTPRTVGAFYDVAYDECWRPLKTIRAMVLREARVSPASRTGQRPNTKKAWTSMRPD